MLLDGELVALRPDGRLELRRCCRRRCPTAATAGLFLYVFDLLHLDGWDLRDCRLTDRKAALQPLATGAVRCASATIWKAQTPRVRRQACAMGLEGIICKRADAPYRAAAAATG